MRFEMTGLKQVQEESLQLHFLIDAKDAEAIKGFLSNHSIIILGIKESSLQPKQFGNVSTKITSSTISQIVLQSDKIEDAIELLIGAGFVIEDINFMENPLPADKVQKILHDILKEIGEEKQEEQEEINKEKEAKKKTFESSQMKKIQPIFDELFAYIDEIKTKTKDLADPQQFKELEELESHLRKRRMGRNLDKIKEILESLFVILDDLYEKYIAHLEQLSPSPELFPGTVNHRIDVIREYHLLQKSKTIKALRIAQSKDDKYYIFSQEFGIYQRFLQKDLAQKLTRITELFFHLFPIVEFSILIISLVAAYYVFSKKIFAVDTDLTQVYGILRRVGVLGLLLFVSNYLKKMAFARLFLLAIGILLGLYVFIYFFSLILAL